MVEQREEIWGCQIVVGNYAAIDQVGKDASSPFAHASKVAYPAGIASKTTVTRPDCLLAENVTVEEKCSIKESVIGANCQIKTGAKLTRCVLMDGVVVGKGCKLTGCILGRNSAIGEDSILLDCEVQENLLVEAKTEDKGNKLMSSEGMEATEQEIQDFDDENTTLDPSESEADADIGFSAWLPWSNKMFYHSSSYYDENPESREEWGTSVWDAIAKQTFYWRSNLPSVQAPGFIVSLARYMQHGPSAGMYHDTRV